MYTRKELVHKLHNGPAVVTFTKKDGEKRVMRCTLEETVVPPAVKTDETAVRKVNDAVLPVWDMEKEAWRSFRLDSVVNVEFE